MPDKAEKNKPEEGKNKSTAKPDPETLHTTDPQEHMKGPVSSFMQNIKDEAEENNAETKEEADAKKDKNL